MSTATQNKDFSYFANKYEKVAFAVKPHYTSQQYPQCGTIVKKSLSTRTHTCKCGYVLQRNHTAAINILCKGKEKIATSEHGESKVSSREKIKKRAWKLRLLLFGGATLNEQVAMMILESPRQ